MGCADCSAAAQLPAAAARCTGLGGARVGGKRCRPVPCCWFWSLLQLQCESVVAMRPGLWAACDYSCCCCCCGCCCCCWVMLRRSFPCRGLCCRLHPRGRSSAAQEAGLDASAPPPCRPASTASPLQACCVGYVSELVLYITACMYRFTLGLLSGALRCMHAGLYLYHSPSSAWCLESLSWTVGTLS